MNRIKNWVRYLLPALVLAMTCAVPAFAAGGDVAGAVEQTWTDAASQIKTVVDSVVFPALSMILAIAFLSNWRCATSTIASTDSSSGLAPLSCLSA